AVVDEAVLDAGRGDERVADFQDVLGRAESEPSSPLEDNVELILVSVRVRLLVLTRRDAVEVELRPRRGGQGDLRHLVRLELRVVLNPDAHRQPSPATLRDEQAPRPDRARDSRARSAAGTPDSRPRPPVRRSPGFARAFARAGRPPAPARADCRYRRSRSRGRWPPARRAAARECGAGAPAALA